MSGDSFLKVTRDDTDFFCECDEKDRIQEILKIKPKFFCINNNSIENVWVYEMLESYFGE